MRSAEPEKSEEEDPDLQERREKALEFALTEIFNYYARTYTERPTDFDQMKH